MPAYNRNNRNSRQEVAQPARAPEVVRPGPSRDAYGRPDWSAYNATVVGAGYVSGAPLHPTCLPGLPPPPPRKLVPSAPVEYEWVKIGKNGKPAVKQEEKRKRKNDRRAARRARSQREREQEEAAAERFGVEEDEFVTLHDDEDFSAPLPHRR